MAQIVQNIDLNNPEFQNLWNMIQDTHRSVFLTGKAGTGKSTFLRYICQNTKKKYVVLAPTGIAAVNVNGQTLHSFFKIPFKPLLPDDPDFSRNKINQTLRYTKQKVKLIKELELIIIDEISMVRADIIDFVDKVLRTYSGNAREPFGGKQLLFVGDIFQLEPVVSRDMRDILRRYYKQFFFFNAQVFSQLGLVPIELRKIYRQTDDKFVSLLDRIRLNRATAADLQLLNSRVGLAVEASHAEMSVTLATRRDTVTAINDEHMDALKTEEYIYSGEIDGSYPDNDLPTSKDLSLKVGAQVIFIKNDREGRWVNGTLGIVSGLSDEDVSVTLENGSEYTLEQDVWENIQYTYNEKEKRVDEVVLGSFKQYPIKPAWALTVHKSQGLTFNRIVVDFSGGAFSSGQTYVALSRCRSLEGITLTHPIDERDIIVNTAVVEFSRSFNDIKIINSALNHEKAQRLFNHAMQEFNHGHWSEAVEAFYEGNEIENVLTNAAVRRLIAIKLSGGDILRNKIEELMLVIEKQRKLLNDLAQEYVAMGDDTLGYGNLAQEREVDYAGKKRNQIDDIAFQAGLANYNKALRIMPDCVPAMIGKSRLYQSIDEKERALDMLNDALNIDKNNCDAMLGMAEIYHDDNDTNAELKMLKKAIKTNRHRPEPHERIATLFDSLGLDDIADEHREMAKKLRLAASKKTIKARKKK